MTIDDLRLPLLSAAPARSTIYHWAAMIATARCWSIQMTRAGYAGMQRYTFAWSGDSGNGNDVFSGWNNLANQVPLALSAGMGLIPF